MQKIDGVLGLGRGNKEEISFVEALKRDGIIDEAIVTFQLNAVQGNKREDGARVIFGKVPEDIVGNGEDGVVLQTLSESGWVVDM